MSLEDKNRMLYFLYLRKVSRDNIIKIMLDLTDSGLFDDDNDNEYDYGDDWIYLEKKSSIIFGDKEKLDKKEEIKKLRKRKGEFDILLTSQYFLEQEERIKAKRQELIKKGIIEPDIEDGEESIKIVTRYGRTPLHEAIVMRDIKLVKKYIENEQYLEDEDNNGHIPSEMAFYENYKEALALFKIYFEKRITRSR